MATTTMMLHQRGNGAAGPGRRYTINLDTVSPLAGALALAATTNNPQSGGSRIQVRSTRTRRAMLDTLSPARADRKREESTVYGIDLDVTDTIIWSGWSPYDSHRWSPEEWLEYTATQIPEGYAPITELVL